MNNCKLWGWHKKPRTMLRFVRPGDIFCFKLDDTRYCFGRIISKITTGHVVELFDYISNQPVIAEEAIYESKRLVSPFIIDTYGLFDRKVYPEGDWRIIGHQNEFVPQRIDDIFFVYGMGKWCKKVDIFDNEVPISEADATKYPRLSPHSDYHVKSLLLPLLQASLGP